MASFQADHHGVFAPWRLPQKDGMFSAQHIIMNSISLYPLGPAQQAALAALVFLPQLLLAEKSSAADNPGLPEKQPELITDFEDHRNHGIGE
jgi:hypothetical protein